MHIYIHPFATLFEPCYFIPPLTKLDWSYDCAIKRGSQNSPDRQIVRTIWRGAPRTRRISGGWPDRRDVSIWTLVWVWQRCTPVSRGPWTSRRIAHGRCRPAFLSWGKSGKGIIVENSFRKSMRCEGRKKPAHIWTINSPTVALIIAITFPVPFFPLALGQWLSILFTTTFTTCMPFSSWFFTLLVLLPPFFVLWYYQATFVPRNKKHGNFIQSPTIISTKY